MKLYDYPAAPNPRRVRVFLAEKGIEVPKVTVDITKSENRAAEYLAKNPMGGVPILELDDGTILAESVAICRYFEETKPEPNLMGRTPLEKAQIEMWNRRMELEVLMMTAGAFRNTHAFFKGRIPQVPEYGAVCKDAALKRLEWLDGELARRKFIAGDRYTIADITVMVAVDFAKLIKVEIPDGAANLKRWFTTVSARPSAKA
jgi:glutathione S-transferase